MKKIVDNFDYSILLHLMENCLLYKNEVDLWYGFFLYYFYFVASLLVF